MRGIERRAERGGFEVEHGAVTVAGLVMAAQHGQGGIVHAQLLAAMLLASAMSLFETINGREHAYPPSS